MQIVCELKIQLLRDESGRESLNLTGPIAQKSLCYATLELAKDAVRAFDPATGGAIALPPGKSPLAL